MLVLNSKSTIAIVLLIQFYQSFCLIFEYSYSAKYVKEYIEGAKPVLSVGEYWDSCKYHGHRLDYDQG